jgi:hypothetical protein
MEDERNLREPTARPEYFVAPVLAQAAPENPPCQFVFDKPIDGISASDHFGIVVDLEVGLDA